MGVHGECGRGWSARCAAAKSKKCRCRCGGSNHGRLSATASIALTVERHASFSIARDTDDALILRDEGPWDTHPTITNDVDDVVRRVFPLLAGRRLCYYDSGGELDEIEVSAAGQFVRFKPGMTSTPA